MKKITLLVALVLISVVAFKLAKKAPSETAVSAQAQEVAALPAPSSKLSVAAVAPLSTPPQAQFKIEDSKKTENVYSEKWFAAEATNMNRLDSDSRGTEAKLQEVARSLKPADTLDLVKKVISSRSENEKILAIHLMGLSDSTPATVFSKIAALNDPVFKMKRPAHSANEHREQFITAISLMALKHLQERVLQSQASAEELVKVSRETNNPLIARLALDAHASVLQGKAMPLEAQ